MDKSFPVIRRLYLVPTRKERGNEVRGCWFLESYEHNPNL